MKTKEEIIHELYDKNRKNTGNGKMFPIMPEQWAIEALDIYAEQFKPKWIPVNQMVPNDTNYVLAFKAGGICLAGYSMEHNSFIRFSNGKLIEYIGITHWMPLPEKPE